MDNKKQYLFICHRDEKEITVETKKSVNTEISLSESLGNELDFKVIGRICTDGISLDFSSNLIEWYEEGYSDNEYLVGDAVVKIIQKLISGIYG